MSVPAEVQERIIAGALREARAKAATAHLTQGDSWRIWLRRNFPAYVRAEFAQRHVDLWDWAWAIEPDVRPRPFVGLWPRGGGKSTSAELVTTALGLRKKRNYALYVCETQDQADKHVATISSQLENVGVERAVNKYGSSKG